MRNMGRTGPRTAWVTLRIPRLNALTVASPRRRGDSRQLARSVDGADARLCLCAASVRLSPRREEVEETYRVPRGAQAPGQGSGHQDVHQ